MGAEVRGESCPCTRNVTSPLQAAQAAPPRPGQQRSPTPSASETGAEWLEAAQQQRDAAIFSCTLERQLAGSHVFGVTINFHLQPLPFLSG